MTAADPFVDLRTVSPDILRPIQPQVDAWLTAPRSEQRVDILGVQFTLRRGPHGPLVRYSELMAVFAKFTELSVASERALRQQAAETEAENDLALAQGRAEGIANAEHRAALDRIHEIAHERDVLAGQMQRLMAENAALAAAKQPAEQPIHALTQERDGLASELRRTKTDRDDLASELRRTKADRDDRLQKMLACGKRIAERAKQEFSRLETEKAALADANQAYQEEAQCLTRMLDERAGLEAEIIARANNMLADNKALENEVNRLTEVDKIAAEAVAISRSLHTEVQNLRVEQRRFKNENARWKAQALGDPRAAVRYWAEKSLGFGRQATARERGRL